MFFNSEDSPSTRNGSSHIYLDDIELQHVRNCRPNQGIADPVFGRRHESRTAQLDGLRMLVIVIVQVVVVVIRLSNGRPSYSSYGTSDHSCARASPGPIASVHVTSGPTIDEASVMATRSFYAYTPIRGASVKS